MSFETVGTVCQCVSWSYSHKRQPSSCVHLGSFLPVAFCQRNWTLVFSEKGCENGRNTNEKKMNLNRIGHLLRCSRLYDVENPVYLAFWCPLMVPSESPTLWIESKSCRERILLHPFWSPRLHCNTCLPVMQMQSASWEGILFPVETLENQKHLNSSGKSEIFEQFWTRLSRSWSKSHSGKVVLHTSETESVLTPKALWPHHSCRVVLRAFDIQSNPDTADQSNCGSARREASVLRCRLFKW